uniref:CSON011991 protein n=1 Tax=Culicoides sonorensis TaxID=179676 RepID=A0A336M4F7_CULSO
MTESTNAGSQAPRPNSGSGADAGSSAGAGGAGDGGATTNTDDGQNEAANNSADEILCQAKSNDIEKGGSATTSRRSRRKHRPLLRRILHYIQTTWIGGKLNPKAGKCL